MATIGSMFYFKYGYRQERKDLQESLRTIVFVHETSFKTAINRLGLVFVGYDIRCKQFVWQDKVNKTIWFIQEQV